MKILKWRKDSGAPKGQFYLDNRPVFEKDVLTEYNKVLQSWKIDKARADQLNDENRELKEKLEASEIDLQIAQTAIQLNEKHYKELQAMKDRYEKTLGLKVNVKA